MPAGDRSIASPSRVTVAPPPTARSGLRRAEVASATQAGEGFLQMTESAEIARRAWAQAKADLAAAVSNSTNGRRLLAIPELRDDVAFCAQRDVFNLVAVLEADGTLRRR